MANGCSLLPALPLLLQIGLVGQAEGVASGRHLGSGEQDQTREKGPDHEAYGDRKRPVGRFQIKPGEDEDVNTLGEFPQKAGDDGSGQHGGDGELAIGEDPIDEKEDSDAEDGRRQLQNCVGEDAKDEVLRVAEEERGKQAVLGGGEGDGEERQQADGEGKAEGDDGVHEVGAVFRDPPDAIEGDFQGQEDSAGGDEQCDHGDDLHLAAGVSEQAHVLDDEVLVRGQEVTEHVAEDGLHRRRMEDVALDGPGHHDEREERQDGVGGDAEGVGVHFCLREIASEGDQLCPPSRVGGNARRGLGDGVGRRGWLDGQHRPDLMLGHLKAGRLTRTDPAVRASR